MKFPKEDTAFKLTFIAMAATYPVWAVTGRIRVWIGRLHDRKVRQRAIVEGRFRDSDEVKKRIVSGEGCIGITCDAKFLPVRVWWCPQADLTVTDMADIEGRFDLTDSQVLDSVCDWLEILVGEPIVPVPVVYFEGSRFRRLFFPDGKLFTQVCRSPHRWDDLPA